jgi:hypothetical protein
MSKSGIAPTARTCMNRVRQNQPGPPRFIWASSEEPGAAIPHAGICEGGVEQSASLPQSAKTNYFDNSMDAASTCIGVFGALLLFAGAISLSLVGNDRDKHDSTGYWIDIWLFSGILTTAVGFVRGLKAATADRKSPKFPLLIILFVGLILTVTSFVMQFSI